MRILVSPYLIRWVLQAFLIVDVTVTVIVRLMIVMTTTITIVTTILVTLIIIIIIIKVLRNKNGIEYLNWQTSHIHPRRIAANYPNNNNEQQTKRLKQVKERKKERDV